MANNVYIGARYVPVFDGAWNSQKVYEPLTIVEYQNSSYTSKKAVPAGTLPTNTTYWALSGNYNGQIANLQSRMTTAEGDIDALESQNGNTPLQTTAQTLSGAVNELHRQNGSEALDTTAQTLSGAVNELHTNITKIPQGRKFVLIGDSYSFGVQGGGLSQVTGWGEYFQSKYPDRTFWYNPKVDGSVPTNENAFMPNNGWKNTLEWVYNNKFDTVDPNEITDIIVLGGSNEPSDDVTSNDLANYIAQVFVPRAKELFPNAIVSIGVFAVNARAMYSHISYVGYKQGCLRSGAVFLEDLFNMPTNDDWYSGYGHLNEDGYSYCNPRILQCIIDGHVEFEWTEEIPLTRTANIVDVVGNYDYVIYKVVRQNSVELRLCAKSTDRGWVLKNNKTWTAGTLNCEAFTFTKGLKTQFRTNQYIAEGHFEIPSHPYAGGLAVRIYTHTTPAQAAFVGFPLNSPSSYTDFKMHWDGATYNRVMLT